MGLIFSGLENQNNIQKSCRNIGLAYSASLMLIINLLSNRLMGKFRGR